MAHCNALPFRAAEVVRCRAICNMPPRPRIPPPPPSHSTVTADVASKIRVQCATRANLIDAKVSHLFVPNRYLVATDCFNFDPRPGLGWIVWANSVAWRYAKMTGRSLVVDWRDTVYLSGRTTNLFTELFEPPVTIDGVEVICEDLERLELPGPRLVTSRDNFRLIDKMIAQDQDLDAAVVEIRAGLSSRHVERSFFEDGFDGFIRALRLRPPFLDQQDSFLDRHFSGKKVIGVHVRHGNGERGHFRQAGRSIADMSSLIEMVKRIIAPYANSETTLFLATDSQLVIDAFRLVFPNLVTREQWRPAPDAGGNLHLGSECPQGEVANAANAWIDMNLLACCDVTLFARGSHMNTIAVQLAKGRSDRKLLYGFDVDRFFRSGRYGHNRPVSRLFWRTIDRAGEALSSRSMSRSGLAPAKTIRSRPLGVMVTSHLGEKVKQTQRLQAISCAESGEP